MRFTGPVWRAHNPEWAWSPISGEGARRHGGRFNRPGRAALYTGLSPMTAILEASPLGRPMQPITLCQYEVDASPVFDARNAGARHAEKVSDADLICPTWNLEMLEGRTPTSQLLAERLINAGFVAMIVPSYARGAGPDDFNCVFWTWGADAPSKVRMVDENRRLPKNPASWR